MACTITFFAPVTMKPPIITLLSVCTNLRVLILPFIELVSGAKIVHFHESNSGGVVYTAHDRRCSCPVAGLQ